MNKHAVLSSKLTLIGSIIYLLIGAVSLSQGLIGPIHFTTKGYQTSAYLWEFSQYPVELSLWAAMVLALLVFGVVGIIFSKKVKKKGTTAQGVILIIIGLFSLLTIAGILFFISGIQTLLSRKKGKEIAM